MSGTSSHVVLEKEDGFYSIRVNYDSHDLMWLFYHLYTKREAWEKIIDKGSASFIGTDLDKKKKETIYEGNYSIFYLDQNKSDDKEDKKQYSKTLNDFCNTFNFESFTFLMNLKNEIYISTQHYEDDDNHDSNYKHTSENFKSLHRFIEDKFDKGKILNEFFYIKGKTKKAEITTFECVSENERLKTTNQIKELYKGDIQIFEEKESFNISVVTSSNLPFYDRS
jgi:hypothetical protein